MTTSVMDKGKAGRTDYSQWDRVTKDLVEETTRQEEQEEAHAKAALGLDGKYASSQDEAAEREKLKQAVQTKEKLENFRKRDTALVQTLSGLFHNTNTNTTKGQPVVVRVTRDDFETGKRVLVLCDTTGASPTDQIILTSDLSKLASSERVVNPNAKSFSQDSENEPTQTQTTQQTTQQMTQQMTQPVYGLIKVNLQNVHNASVIVETKLIAGMVEIHNCSHLTVRFEATATVYSVQADVSQTITLEWYDAEKEPRIYHAGVSDLTMRLHTKAAGGSIRFVGTADYRRDGAVAVGNAVPEEVRFITQLVNGKIVTEKVVQAGPKAMTERELKVEQARRELAELKMVETAESMIKITDKHGNPLVKKTMQAPKEDEEIEEVLSPSVQHALHDCQAEKQKGNDSFQAGEYAQAILHYSLALDTAAQLSDDMFPADILYSNRAACFLKMGHHEKAEQDATKALQLNPSNIKAQFRQGLALHALKRYQEALPLLAMAHKLEPKNKQIKQALQFCEVRLDQEHRKRMEG
jgi:Flp pilus assembly protein TadD